MWCYPAHVREYVHNICCSQDFPVQTWGSCHTNERGLKLIFFFKKNFTSGTTYREVAFFPIENNAAELCRSISCIGRFENWTTGAHL
jgi:hypothetical protein